jgi:hypothetical protein
MKKPTKKQLHSNFILIHQYYYDNEPIKGWVRKDEDYNGNYHDDIDFLITVIRKIGEYTGYELVMKYESSYWNKFGENPLVDKKGNTMEFGGYGDTLGIYQAVVAFIKWYNKTSK